MKQLPIGIQDFNKIVEGNYLYIDKTEYIHRLITSNNACFLSRPRRFGKSLLISTLEEIFNANTELFKGLWIAQSNYNWKKHPVIRIDFSKLNSQTVISLKTGLNLRIKEIAQNYGLDLTFNEELDYNTYSLIKELCRITKERVVILIDEYDSPIISNINHPEVLDSNRELLASFYRTIKGCDEHLRFVFLTGVSKFAKVSVFSGLNNLRDITLSERYSNLLGYTQAELEQYFDEDISELTSELNIERSAILNEIKRWYNGYRFTSKDNRVYNPFSTLLFFSEKKFENYWFETGTPTFLLDLIKKHNYNVREFEGMKLGDEDFASYDTEHIPLISLLYNTGYITIDSVEKMPDMSYQYEMCYPNYEVRSAFLGSVAKHFTGYGKPINVYVDALRQAIAAEDVGLFIETLQTLFASIPYDLEPSSRQIKSEAHYQSILYAVLKVTGMQISAEERTNKGRVDLVIEGKDAIYLFEMKVDKPASDAIEQIKKRGYAEKYRLSDKKLRLVGLSFSSAERNISQHQIEEI